MLVALDCEGRIALPAEGRARFDLGPGAELELEVDQSGFRLRPAQRARRRLSTAGDGLPVIEAVGTTTSTDAGIRTWRDADQR